ncbi:MAG: sugar phosphate isomerase/epimerase [Candidatus Omnitrophica bacterium]|nr:sugar phosphate isomerase/epimerase [Candidatus Omnitrophota bacterium]
MKLGLCSWSYNRTFDAGKMDLEKLLHVCADELKVGGIDIIDVHLKSQEPGYLLKIKKLATDLQITISAVSPGNSFGKDNEADEKAEVEKICKWTDTAYLLGAPNLRIFAGWAPPERHKELWPKVVKSIKECAKYAEKKGVVLAIESHNDGGYLPTSVETHRLLEDVNSPWVKLNLDTGNYKDRDMYAALEKSIPYTTHMHAKIHKMSKDGKELEFDYDKIFGILKRANYRGFFNVEYEGKEDELTYVPISLGMVRRFIKKYEMF